MERIYCIERTSKGDSPSDLQRCLYFGCNVSPDIAAAFPSSHAKSTLDESTAHIHEMKMNNRKDCVTDDEETQ